MRPGGRGIAAGILVFAASLGTGPHAFADYESAREALERGQRRAGVAALRAAAHDGDARAQNHLGALYEDGDLVVRNFGRAVFWYRKAAEQGDPRGQLNLGRMYRGGMGIQRDERRAAYWYRAAAEQGVPEAQFFLGLMRESGRGVERDPVQAWMWFRLAADQGDEDASFRRARLEAELGEETLAKAREELRGAPGTAAGRSRPPPRAEGDPGGRAGAKRAGEVSAQARAAPVRGDPIVFRIQAALIALGYSPGEHDGQPGSRTREAARLFETERRFRPTGRLDERLLGRLHEAIEDGKLAGSLIREIQTLLERLGHPVGEIDGLPGPRTTSAVEAFQRDRGLPVDGRLGVPLLDRLREAASRPADRQ